MQTVRDQLSQSGAVWVCHFDFRPSKLFEGAEQRLTIFINHRGATKTVCSSKYNRWYAEERAHLFSTLAYAAAPTSIALRSIWPKTGNALSAAILQKTHDQPLSVNRIVGQGSRHLFYKNTGILYFTTFTREAPACFINGIATPSSRETTVSFREPAHCEIMHCFLNSTAFYLMYQMHSNCRDLNPSDITSLRVPASLLDDRTIVKLSDSLWEKQRESSHFIVRMQQLTGEVRIQAFFPAKCKQAIDRVDHAIAKHYGFTDEELDFIINYDIKYRMGINGDGDAEEDE